MRSIVLEGEKGSIGFGNLQNLWVKRHSVILPRVLQIHETMVLQRVELDRKVCSGYFWIFVS